MKRLSTLLSFSTVISVVSAVFLKDDLSILRRADTIVEELGPLLSPGASIILPADNTTHYQELTARYIEVFHPDITAIVKVGTEADIPQIINYAKGTNRAFLTGSARHGWATSLSNIHNAIMIDIDTLTSINVDTTANTMTVGGGVTIGSVLATLQAAGKETQTGICDCVGLLGATLGGGHGRMQGLHGLMADNLISARLVTAAGEVITVSSTSHVDLFWGLRGAGHNFGIVTEAVFKIYDQTNGGMQFNADIAYSADQLEALFTAINNFEQSPETTVLVVLIPLPDHTPYIALSFVSSTPTEVARAELDAAFGHIPYLTRDESVLPWSKINELGALGVGKVACASTDRKNAYGASLKHYDIPTIRKVYNYYAEFIASNPTATGSIMLFETYPSQAVQAIDYASTAYPHREERHIILVLAGYPDASLDVAAKGWLDKATAELHATGGFKKPRVYMNYAQGTEGFGALYGYEEWRQRKLKTLKRKYDPEGVFSGYHPIPL